MNTSAARPSGRRALRATHSHGLVPALFAAAALFAAPDAARAQDAPSPITWGVDLTMEHAWVADGGWERRAGVLWNLDVTAELDGSAIGWSGGRIFAYLLGNAGTDPSRWAGDLQTASNIEAPRALRFFEAWVEQSLLDGRFRLLAGLHDLNADFYVMETGGLFLHSSHGIGTEFSQTGENGPSIFPNAALTVMATAELAERLRVRFSVRDAVPGDPERPEVTTVNLSSDEGLLWNGEVEFGPGPLDETWWKVVVGGWAYSRDRPGVPAPLGQRWIAPGRAPPAAAARDVVFPSVADRGFYLIGEGRLGEVSGGVVDGFARVGRAEPSLWEVDWGWGGGVVWSRGRDRAGLALAVAELGHLASSDGAEWAWEATWARSFGDHLEISWDAQWIRHAPFPGSPESALVLHQRVVLGL